MEDQSAFKEQELKLRQQQLELDRTRLFIEFAKYGFAGTLTAAILGLATIMGLAVISALTSTKIDTWGLVAIAAIVLIGSVAFGFFSLWELPRIAGRFLKTQFEINPDEARKQPRAGKD